MNVFMIISRSHVLGGPFPDRLANADDPEPFLTGNRLAPPSRRAPRGSRPVFNGLLGFSRARPKIARGKERNDAVRGRHPDLSRAGLHRRARRTDAGGG